MCLIATLTPLIFVKSDKYPGATAGLQSTQTSNNDLRMILDNFLNGGEQT